MISSPCVGECRINPATGYCFGCYRSLDEIAKWSAMTSYQRKLVYEEIDKRKDRILRRRLKS